MNKSDLFAYLAAFISIVLAVALTDMVQSTHRLIRARDRVNWDALTPLLALSVFLGLLSAFFSVWGDARFERITYYGLVGFMAGPAISALVAFAVLPDEVPENGLDLRQFYFENRRYIVVLLLMLAAGDIVWTLRWAMIMHALDKPQFWWHFGPVATINLILLATIYFAKQWRMHLMALIALLALGHFAFSGWYIEAMPGV